MPARGQNAERNVAAIVVALRRLSRGDDCRRVDLFPSGTRGDVNGWQSDSIKALAKAGVVQIVGDTIHPGARRGVRYRLVPGVAVLDHEAVARLLYPPLRRAATATATATATAAAAATVAASQDNGHGTALSARELAHELGCTRATAQAIIQGGLIESHGDESGMRTVTVADARAFKAAWPPEVPLTPTTVAREADVGGGVADANAQTHLLRIVAESLARVHDRLGPLEVAVADCRRVLRTLE